MQQQYYYAKRSPEPRKKSWRPLFTALIVGVIGLLTVQVVNYATHSHATPHTDPQLQQAIDTWVGQQSFESTVYVAEQTEGLRTGAHGVDTIMVTASTYKVFVAYAVLHQAEQGKLNLSARTSTGQTVQNTLNKMILQSDNTSAEALGSLVGWDTVDSLAASAGATHTNINNYDSSGNPTKGDKRSTAGDLALMLTKLNAGTLLNATDTELLIGLMKNQVWRERIPAGVPSTVAVADKPGWLPNIQNDAAIVYGPESTYVVVIMTTSNSTQPLTNLSQVIYNLLQTKQP